MSESEVEKMYRMGREDGESVQKYMSPEEIEEYWFTPEEAMANQEKTEDPEMKAYYKGYLSRFD